jgi:ferredoxin-NADP reductase
MPPSLVSLPVRSLVRATSRATLLTLSVDERRYRFAPGQAVMLGVRGAEARKPYSIASSPADVRDRGVLEFLVGSDPDAVGAHLLDVRPGRRIDVEGPFGTFVLPDPVGVPRVLLIAGGTGIAPLRSMWRHLLPDRTAPRVTLAYSVRTLADVAFGDEIDELVTKRRLEAVVTLSREQPADRSHLRGRLNPQVVGALVGDGNAVACVCGPDGFVADLTLMLVASGLPVERVLREARR